MAANGVKTSEDADMSECDGEKVVTMMDVLQEQQDFEEDANAVLGGSDDKNCTYSKGYVKRQAIYACLTCCPGANTDPMKRAGVCLACSLNCHENHDLIELYTKRNFRCDCGNPKFSQPCQFTPNKSDLNYENKYNQNFSGTYCVCKRPYPDPEANEEEEMIQCIICEDWLHINHLEATVPNNELYAEMICKDCMEDNDFLHDYSDLVVNVADKEIIVTDPDLDFTAAERETLKAKQAKLSNGITDAKNDTTESRSDTDKKAEDENILDNIDSVVDENKKDETTDVKMNETKPDESGDDKVCNEETKNDKAVENADETKAAGDVNQDIAAEPKEDQKEEGVKKTDENDVDENMKEQNTEIEKPEKVEEKEQTSDIPESTNKDDASEDAKPDSATETKVDESESATEKVSDGEMQDVVKDDLVNTTAESEDMESVSPSKQENKRKLSTEDTEENSSKKAKIDTKPCVRPRGVKRLYKGSTFWPSTFRQKLCTCNECVAMYKDLAVLYLTDLDDTVTAYEALGKEIAAPSSQYEKGLQALSSLDRVQQINALTEYNKMRDKLLDFLKSFKDRKEIVKEEDIKAFFAGMKPKREPDGVYFCR